MAEHEGDGVRSGSGAPDGKGWVETVVMALMLAVTCFIIVVSWNKGNVVMAGIGVLVTALFLKSVFSGGSRRSGS